MNQIQESKYTYLAIGIISGLALAYAYNKWTNK
ncbi:hypothetical protein GvMRE_IIg13 [endosymbiont GvMRE of Glomus versiforme]|nr:hypothetical protein GvMRE_IIg13 [endosymbiont GvMRE of Glomus versiforme]